MFKPEGIRAVTAHKSDLSIDSYNNKPSMQQFEEMSSILSTFVSGQRESTTVKSFRPKTSDESEE